MQVYFDVEVVVEAEIPAYHVMETVYTRLHQWLVHTKRNDVGIVFPGYNLAARTLGKCLRVVGTDVSLRELSSSVWLRGLQDYIRVSTIAMIPESANWYSLRRVQVKSNPSRLARRYAKRHNLPESDASAIYTNMRSELTTLPYLNLRSASTGQLYKLFLKLDVIGTEVPSCFTTFGLSETGTIPMF